MNYTQVAKELHMTLAGARKKILTNQEVLEPFLIKDPSSGKIKGIDSDGLEVLRSLPSRNNTNPYNKQKKALLTHFELETYKNTLAIQTDQIDTLNQFIEHLQKQVAFLETQLKSSQDEIVELKSQYKNQKLLALEENKTIAKKNNGEKSKKIVCTLHDI